MDTTYFDFGKAFGHVSEGEQSCTNPKYAFGILTILSWLFLRNNKKKKNLKKSLLPPHLPKEI